MDTNAGPPLISIDPQSSANTQTFRCEAMACSFHFHLVGERTGLMDSAVMEAEELLAKLEERLSLYIEYSDTTRINRAAPGEGIPVGEDTIACLLSAFDASERLRGKFHPFLGQSALRVKGQAAELPHLAGLESETPADDRPVIALDESRNSIRKLRAGPILDLGGIGKGFALDRLANHFREWDFGSGLLESGGSTFLSLDTPPGIDSWRLTIGYGEQTQAIQLRSGQAIASSGELYQGTHVVDPDPKASPYSWKRSYASGASAAFADAASTAALLFDHEDVASIAASEPDLSLALYSESDTFQSGPLFAEA